MTIEYSDRNPFVPNEAPDTGFFKRVFESSAPIPSFTQEKIRLAICIILFIGAKTVDLFNPHLGGGIRFVVIVLSVKPILNIHRYISGNPTYANEGNIVSKISFNNAQFEKKM